MEEILNEIGRAIGAFFDNPIIQTGLRLIAFYIVAMWLVTAYWAYRDLQKRTTNPVAPYLAAALIILFTPILFPFAVVMYKILRPPETVAESNERALAEEAMLVEVESQPHCANCNRRVHIDWIICPTCRNRLRRVCPNCSRLVELDWSLCAWCGKDFERVDVPPFPAAAYNQAPALSGAAAPALGPASQPALSPAQQPMIQQQSSPSAQTTSIPTREQMPGSEQNRPAPGPFRGPSPDPERG
jgi:RNA polymerase subunit RPABC4/transcription elongation factor Spt4